MNEADTEFEGEYDSMQRAAYRAAYRLLGERTAAEDVASEVLVRAYARWSSVRSHALPWVVTVATNLALDIGRQRGRASRRQVLVDEMYQDPVELRMDLIRALDALPRRQREVVALRFLGDFSEQAVADALGINVGTVKSHTSRGLCHLRLTVERV